MGIKWKAEAAAVALTKKGVQAAVAKFKNVTVQNVTEYNGITSITLFAKVDKTIATTIFSLAPTGAKWTVSRMEIMAEIPKVVDTAWKRVKLENATGTLNQVLTAINTMLQARAVKPMRKQASGGAPVPSNAPKGKLVDPKKWYVIDTTGKEFITSGPYATEKVALKQARPDGPKGVVYEDVMTGADCKANGIKWR